MEASDSAKHANAITGAVIVGIPFDGFKKRSVHPAVVKAGVTNAAQRPFIDHKDVCPLGLRNQVVLIVAQVALVERRPTGPVNGIGYTALGKAEMHKGRAPGLPLGKSNGAQVGFNPCSVIVAGGFPHPDLPGIVLGYTSAQKITTAKRRKDK